tara:strand:+ start:1215 stop:2366 length:1152 start_codon:yes stop_codon:yes gene_type:complete
MSGSDSQEQTPQSLIDQFNQKRSELPSQNQLFFFFTVLTIVYGIIVIAKIITSGTTDDCSIYEINSSLNGNIYTIIYVLLLLGGSYYINDSIARSICNINTKEGEEESEISSYRIFGITFLPWIIIFGVIYLLLELFPGWIKPFSNTLGYLVINLLGIEKIYKDTIIRSDTTEENDRIYEAIMKMNENYHTTINQFPVDVQEYKDFIRRLRRGKLIQTNPNNANDYYCKFYSYICAKEFIGKLMWYILSGGLISAISYNFIMNLECKNKNINNRIDRLDEKNNKPLYYGLSWRKIGDKHPSQLKSSNIEYKNIVSHPTKYKKYNQFIIKYKGRFIDSINHDINKVEFTAQELKLSGILEQFSEGSYITVIGDDSKSYYFVVDE